MNRQRKVVITITYNDLGVIVDTKAEELDSSAQPNLQPTCNQLATETISRQAAKLEMVEKGQRSKRYKIGELWELNRAEIWEVLDALPSVQPEIIRCKDCRFNDGTAYCVFHFRDVKGNDFCSWAERRTDD